MASSLIGGSFDRLSQDAQGIVDSILGDTVGGQITTSSVGSGTLFTSTGAGGTPQGVLIGQNGLVVAGEIDTGGGVSLSVVLPGGISLAFEGTAGEVTGAGAGQYLNGLVDQYLPRDSTDPAVQQARQNLQDAIDAVVQSLGGVGSSQTLAVRFVVLSDNGTAANGAPNLGGRLQNTTENSVNKIVFNGDGDSNELVTFLMSKFSSADKTVLTLKDVKAALIVGNSTVVVNDSANTIVSGDANNQNITGGTGNDTLVGGGGTDTLTGGSGSDVFGFNALGNLTITDFNVTQDKLAFVLPGSNNLAGFTQLFTGLTVEGNNSVLNFGSSSITLVGVNPADLTVDLLQFTLTL
jgi:Ca2+-binding RTX toxin-like protein